MAEGEDSAAEGGRHRFWDGRGWRDVAQFAFIAVLVISAIVQGHDVDELRANNGDLVEDVRAARADTRVNAAAVESVETLLADVCAAAPERALEDDGLDSECKLAEAGNIEEQVPIADGDRVDDGGSGLNQDQVQGVVADYVRRYLTDLPPGYRDDLRAAVVDYLADRRGPRGQRGRAGADARPPTTRQIAAAAAAYLQANPPPPGPAGDPGAAGRGLVTTFLDGCDVVFTYTDGSTSRVGPLCGPQGPQGVPGEPGRPPTTEEVAAALDAYCAARPDGDCVGAQGPAGAAGATGPAGPAGRGIASIECEATTVGQVQLTVRYDDGTTQTVDCTAPAEPPPEP